MKELIETIKKNSLYYTINFIFLVSCGYFLLVTTKAESFIILNSIRIKWLRIFFETYTQFGDGLFVILISLAILLISKKNRKLAILILVAYAASGIFTQILKSVVLSARPKIYFQIHQLNFYIDTFINSKQGFRSFPSGHTVSAFAIATVVSNYFRKRYIYIIMFVYAVLIGYSRIYLAHHFLIDVVIGAFVGVLVGTLTFVGHDKIANLKFWKSIPGWSKLEQFIKSE
jgi:membrane-associated phospholipid phosphatase